jgi:hypothetical protein
MHGLGLRLPYKVGWAECFSFGEIREKVIFRRSIFEFFLCRVPA